MVSTISLFCSNICSFYIAIVIAAQREYLPDLSTTNLAQRFLKVVGQAAKSREDMTE